MKNEEGIIADSEGEEKVSEDGEPDTGDWNGSLTRQEKSKKSLTK